MIKQRSYFSRERELERMEKQEQKNLKKRRKIIRAGHESLLAAVIRVLFLGMLILLPLTFAVEMIVALEGKRTEGLLGFFLRSSQALLYIWLIFGMLTILFCGIQLVRVYCFGYRERVFSFADEISDRDFGLYSKVNETSGNEEELILYAGPEQGSTQEKYKKIVVVTVAVGISAAALCLVSFVLQGAGCGIANN